MSAAKSKTQTGKDYLAEYDATPDAEKYPLVQKWMKQEPLPFFAQLRKERPVLVTPDCTLLANFVDIRDVLQMPKIFTVNLYKPKMGAVGIPDGYLMAYDDGALHYREKSLMQGFLNRDDLPRVRALIKEAANDILEDADDEIEIINEYCRMVPAILVQDYFGLDGIDRDKLVDWSFWNQYDVFHNQPFDLNPPKKYQHIIDEHDRVTSELLPYIASLLVRKLFVVQVEYWTRWIRLPFQLIKRAIYGLMGKKVSPRKDDMVKRMLETSFAKEVDFGLKRVGVNAGGLLIGSIETTAQAVAQVIEYFIEHPELLQDAKTKALWEDTSQFDALVWEALRFVPISPYMFRQTAEDYTVAKGTQHETMISSGTNVLVLTQSAMFDEYAYSDPDTFNPDRNWYHNFNFGFASHDCLGKYVGMEMIPEMVRQVLLRENIHGVGKIDYSGGPYVEPGEPTPFPQDWVLKWGADVQMPAAKKVAKPLNQLKRSDA